MQLSQNQLHTPVTPASSSLLLSFGPVFFQVHSLQFSLNFTYHIRHLCTFGHDKFNPLSNMHTLLSGIEYLNQLCTYIRTYVHTHTHIYIYVCTYVCIYVHNCFSEIHCLFQCWQTHVTLVHEGSCNMTGFKLFYHAPEESKYHLISSVGS